MLAELEEIKNKQELKIAKLSAELKQLATFIQHELGVYNQSIVKMREELLRFKKENKELRDRERQLMIPHKDVSHHASGKQNGNYRSSTDVNTAIVEMTEMDDKEHSTRTTHLLKADIITRDQVLEIDAIKKAMETMKSYHEKERKEMKEENNKLQRQLANLIETLQRPESVNQSNRPQLVAMVSKGSDRQANAASSRYGAPIPHDSGFLSLSKHSVDKISASSTGGNKEDIKRRVPKLNTEAAKLAANFLQPGEKHPLTSGGRVSYGAEEDRSDSLFISQKLSEDLAVPFTDEESVEDRFAKQRIVKDILRTTPY